MGHLKRELNSLFLHCSFYDSSGTFFFFLIWPIGLFWFQAGGTYPPWSLAKKKNKTLKNPHLHSFLNKEETLRQAIGKANAPSVNFKSWQSLWSLKCCIAELAVSGPTLIQSLCTLRHVHVNHTVHSKRPTLLHVSGESSAPLVIFLNSKLFPLWAFAVHGLGSRSTHSPNRSSAVSVSLWARSTQPIQMHLSPYFPVSQTTTPPR